MKKRTVFILMMALMFVGIEASHAYVTERFPICQNAGSWAYGPAVDGDIVVWQDTRIGGGGWDGWDIYGYDLSTQAEFPICLNPKGQWMPDISGNFVVWCDNRNFNWDIYGYNILTKTEFPICTDSADQGYVGQTNHAIKLSISGNIVVWTDTRNGNQDIYGFDLSTGTEFSICTDVSNQINPSVCGDIVVWQDSRNGNGDIYGYDLSTGIEFPICLNGSGQAYPCISGDIVVWEDSRNADTDIYGYDLSTNTEFVICSATGLQRSGRINGNIVVWEDNRDGVGGLDVYGYDLSSQTEFPISTYYDDRNPDIAGGLVVYSTYQSGYNYNVYGAYILTHDECTDAIEIKTDVPFCGSTNSSTGIDETSCGVEDTNDVWHSYTPESNGEVTISLYGSSFDTTLAIFDGCGGTELTCNGNYPNVQSLEVTAGNTYLVRVAGNNGQTGHYVLDMTLCTEPIASDLNNDCKVDFLDFAIFASDWLKCNIDPPEACWQ